MASSDMSISTNAKNENDETTSPSLSPTHHASESEENEKSTGLGPTLQGRGKQYSVESVKALHSIQDIKKNYEAMLQQAEQIHKDTVADDYEDATKAKAKLAQLLGSIEKLQFNQLDAVTTAHLDSGKAEAKTTRRELNASLDELQEFVRSLYKKFDAVMPPPSPPRPPSPVAPVSSTPVIPVASHTVASESDSDSTSDNDEENAVNNSDEGDDDNGSEEDDVDKEETVEEAAVEQLKAQVHALAQSRQQQHAPPQARKLKINYGGKQRDQQEEPIMQQHQPQHQHQHQQRLREQQLHRAHLLREQERQEQLRWQQEQQWREQQRQRYALQQQQQREQQLREQKLRQQQLRQQQLRQHQLQQQQQQYYRHHHPRRSMEDNMFGGFYF